MRFTSGIFLMCFVGSPALAKTNDVDQITGQWRAVMHSAEVRIEDCGDGTPCAFLVSVGEDVRGAAIKDERNKNPKLRSRSLDGLPIFWGYEANERGWEKGKLYNPETGQTFRSSLYVVSTNKIKVKGCLGPFCRAQVWTRITDASLAKMRSNPDD